MSERISYEESYRILQKRGHSPEKDVPLLPLRLPTAQDEGPLGISFFRTLMGEEESGLAEDMGNMTLPRTFFGRTEVRQTSFKNTDLPESCLCWNDFIEVDFTKARLPGSDLRCSFYDHALFVQADLSGADLRRVTLEACDFTAAIMDGAKLTHDQREPLNLSQSQCAEIARQDEDGEEPED